MYKVCKVLDAALHNKRVPDLTAEEWQQVARSLDAHAVKALCFHVLQGHISAAELQNDFFSHYAALDQFLVAQDELVSILRDAGISCIVLKGLAAASLYPEPALRSLGDIDMLVDEASFFEARDLLIANGYTLENDNDFQANIKTAKHIGFEKYGMEVELHRRPFTCAQESVLEYLYQYSDMSLKRPYKEEIDHYVFPVYRSLPNAIEYLMHMKSHITGGGLGLRQVLDWMLFVEKYVSDEYYDEELSVVLKTAGLDTFARVVTLSCQKYLGLPEEITWCRRPVTKAEYEVLDIKPISKMPIRECTQEQLSEHADQFMNHVLVSGNFGRSADSSVTHGAQVFQRSPKEFLQKLYEGGKLRFPELYKNRATRVLLPFAQLGLMTKSVLTGQNNLLGSMRQGQKQKKMFEDIGLM